MIRVRFLLPTNVERKSDDLNEVRGWKMEDKGGLLSAIRLFYFHQGFADRGIYHKMVVAFMKGKVTDGMDDV
jgi:hypothetical protein